MDDAVTTLVAVLAAGAAAGLKETAAAAIGDAYEGLKAIIVRKFGPQPAIEALERAPSSKAKQDSASEDLVKAARDEEVLARARELLEVLKRDSPEAGRVVGVELRGVEAEALEVRNVASVGKGVVVEGSKFTGPMKIDGVAAGPRADRKGP